MIPLIYIIAALTLSIGLAGVLLNKNLVTIVVSLEVILVSATLFGLAGAYYIDQSYPLFELLIVIWIVMALEAIMLIVIFTSKRDKEIFTDVDKMI
ncbi:MAG: NADH-quinone oxidoreductase subunit K [Candidatus Micrarchaeota archaeon]|nr:MAG: NADH-quinone oxidoreductase subunit K [Candidatus Micrarchaeota archaeon]